MEKEKTMHVLAVLLDELTQNLWHDAIACWNLSGDDGETLDLTLLVYEGYNIPLTRLQEMISKFDVPTYNLSFRNNNGTLEISIAISSN